MNNPVKIKFTKNVTMHLSGMIDRTVQNSNLTVTKAHTAIITGHEKRTDMQNN